MSAAEQTANDAFKQDDYKVRIRHNGDHIAIMSFCLITDRFMRVNITPEDWARLVTAADTEGKTTA